MKQIIWLLPIIILLACPDQQNLVSYRDQYAKIDAVYTTFSKAYQDKDTNLIASIYNQDAYYLTPGDTIRRGQDTFIPGFAAMFSRTKQDTVDLTIQFDILSRDIEGSLAVDIGYYHLSRKKKGKEIHQSTGKFITVLRKQTNGSWKFTADGYSEVGN